MRDSSDTPESNLADDNNADLKHTEASVMAFLDRPLSLDDALTLTAEALAEDEEIVAVAIDRLISARHLVFVNGLVVRADREGLPPPTCQRCPAPMAMTKRWDGSWQCSACGMIDHVDLKLTPEQYAHSMGVGPCPHGNDCTASAPESNRTCNHPWPGKKQGEQGWCGRCGLGSKAARDPMQKVYDEWLAIVNRHPEWTAKLKPGTDRDVNIHLDDPAGTMQGVKDVFEYDAASVRPEDQAEFQRFLELDRLIEDFERKNPPRTGSLRRARAMYRMLGGRSLGLGFTRHAGVLIAKADLPVALSRGDLVYALADEIARVEQGVGLGELTWQAQLEIMERAEMQALEKYPVISTAQMGPGTYPPGIEQVPPQLPSATPTPAPEPPVGWEKFTGPDGKEVWRSISDPNAMMAPVERPQ